MFSVRLHSDSILRNLSAGYTTLLPRADVTLQASPNLVTHLESWQDGVTLQLGHAPASLQNYNNCQSSQQCRHDHVSIMLQQFLGTIHVNICWPDAISTCQSEGREGTPHCHAYVSWLAWNPECGVNHKTLLSIKHGTAPSHAKQHERTTRILVKSIVIHLLVTETRSNHGVTTLHYTLGMHAQLHTHSNRPDLAPMALQLNCMQPD